MQQLNWNYVHEIQQLIWRSYAHWMQQLIGSYTKEMQQLIQRYVPQRQRLIGSYARQLCLLHYVYEGMQWIGIYTYDLLLKTYNGLGYNIWILSYAYDAMQFGAILMSN